MKCIAAFTPETPPDGFPPYINASLDTDGLIRVIVRSTAANGGGQGQIDMTRAAWTEFVRDCVTESAQINRVAN